MSKTKQPRLGPLAYAQWVPYPLPGPFRGGRKYEIPLPFDCDLYQVFLQGDGVIRSVVKRPSLDPNNNKHGSIWIRIESGRYDKIGIFAVPKAGGDE